LEDKFKATIVLWIMNGEVEKALKTLAKKYGVKVPSIKVGLPKRYKMKARGCYNGRKRMISVLNSDTLRNPFVVLHEFYHHLRTSQEGKHRGTEKYADAFANDFIFAFKSDLANEK
jgi:Zn-dependent peptidase ImmA (M78 family)